MPQLAQQPHGLLPPKNLFHACAFTLTDGTAGIRVYLSRYLQAMVTIFLSSEGLALPAS